MSVPAEVSPVPPVPPVPSFPSEPPPELFEQIGRLCAAWAYVEYQVERTIWGVLIIDELVGQHITYRLDMRGRWDLIMSIARDHFNKLEREQLKGMSDKIPDLTTDRNLYVHGIMSARPPDWEITGTLYRGKDSGKPKPLTTAGVIACREGIQAIGTELRVFNDAKGYRHELHGPTEPSGALT